MANSEIPFVSTREIVTLAAIVQDISGSKTVNRAFRMQGLPDRLRHDVNSFIPNTEYVKLLENFARLTGLQYFGVMIGELCLFAEMGAYGRYVTSAPTLEHAIRRARRALCFHETGSSLEIQKNGRETKLVYTPASLNTVGVRHLSEGVASLLINLVRHYAGPAWSPDYIDLDFMRVSRRRDLEDHFKTKVHLNTKGVGVPVPNYLLPSVRQLSIPASKLMTIHDLRRMTENPPPGNFTSIVRQVLEFRMRDGASDIEGVSEWLNLGHRTVQRRLKVEGCTFRELQQVSLYNWANELLAETDATITEIAMALGYSSMQHFIRAYQKWAGVTPGRFRVRNAAQSTNRGLIRGNSVVKGRAG
ncbi:MAG: AraC family transcriptional regulator ligand-binding domain-containing protein [Paracoccaceae bacterium]